MFSLKMKERIHQNVLRCKDQCCEYKTGAVSAVSKGPPVETMDKLLCLANHMQDKDFDEQLPEKESRRIQTSGIESKLQGWQNNWECTMARLVKCFLRHGDLCKVNCGICITSPCVVYVCLQVSLGSW